MAPLVKDGSAIPLAVAHPTRMPQYPDVPTLLERGVSSVPHGSWVGVFVPAGTSDDHVACFIAAVRFAMDDPSVVAQINELGMEVSLNESPEEFVAFIEAENVRLGQAVERHGLEFD